MFIHCPQKRRIWVKYYIGWHKVLADVLPASQDVKCRALISNGEASGWASHAEGGNVSQAPKEKFWAQRKKRSGEREFIMM